MAANHPGQNGEGGRATLVKICGVTNREDAHTVIEAGADAIGFIGVGDSPRYVSAQAFQRIREVLPSDFPVVVVVRRLCDAAKYGAPIVQYYEESDLDAGLDPAPKKIRVARVRNEDGVAEARAYGSEYAAVLLDGFQAGTLGGSGAKVDWRLVAGLPDEIAVPVILAGGLRPGTVADALEIVRPYAVDVSSGVEDHTIGKKNPDLVTAFVRAVRAWDRARGAAAVRERFLA